jgi:NAD(P)H-dependent flavin oxidoreductase YrpB (nitropropane dioxygenase family)
MKQKYSIHKDTEKQRLVIKEYGELNKEILSLLCEESYAEDVVQAAITEGKEAVVKVLRTRNMYPPGVFANSLADLVIALYGSQGEQSTEIMLDDKEFFQSNEMEAPPEEAEVESEEEDIDAVLDDDIGEVYEEKKVIKDLKSTLKVADEDAGDTDDDI